MNTAYVVSTKRAQDFIDGMIGIIQTVLSFIQQDINNNALNPDAIPNLIDDLSKYYREIARRNEAALKE